MSKFSQNGIAAAILYLFAATTLFSQVPQAISYQAIVRDASGTVLPNQDVSLRISILEGSINGPTIYAEIHPETTNQFGLINLKIGKGIPQIGLFGAIDWANGSFFTRIEIDISGGTNYFEVGVSEMLSVPYALYAKKASEFDGTILETDPTVPGHVKAITPANITEWTEAHGWGNHAVEGYLTSITETDPTVPGHVKTITPEDITEWTEAHGWGNHAVEGYLTSITETDPTVPGHVKAITQEDITEWTEAHQWGNHAVEGYLTSITETDPTVPQHVKAITQEDITEWTEAHQWGNHAVEGYLTTFTEADPTVPEHVKAITPEDITEWTEAHGWGNHAIEGYLTSFTETDPLFNSNFDLSDATEGNTLRFDGEKFISSAQQQLSIDGNLLSISDGNTVALPMATTSSLIPILTTAQIASLSPQPGESVFNSTDNLYLIYTGQAWAAFTPTCWPQPTTANAGPNQENWNGNTTVVLAANTPEIGHGMGQWTIISGEGGSFADDTDPNTTFTAQLFENYTLQWSITTFCGVSSDLVEIWVGMNDDYPDGYVHCNPNNPTEIVEVTNPTTGRTWMDRNLGASQVATSSTDAASYGDLYQWGRFADGHQCRTSPTTSTLSSTDQPGHSNFITVGDGHIDWRNPQNHNLWQGDFGINNPCPTGFRLPSQAEFEAERLSWNSNNAAGATSSFLKLPLAGYRHNNGMLTGVDGSGGYWSKDVTGNSSLLLNFGATSAGMASTNRARGYSIRCIKFTGGIGNLNCNAATNTGTLIHSEAASGVSSVISYSAGNGETHQGQEVNSTGVTGLTATLEPGSFAIGEGTLTYTITGTPTSSGNAVFEISIGSQSCSLSLLVDCWSAHNATDVVEVINPTTGRTWMDRNLGASQVATSSTDAQAYGDLYQWGRGGDGHQCRTSPITSTLSSTDQPGHGNFITIGDGNVDWRSPQNNDLWQGVDGVNNPCPAGFRLPTKAEFDAERLTWGSNNADGAFNSSLKLPLAGYRHNNGSLTSVDTDGGYWSGTPNPHSIDAYLLSFHSTGAGMYLTNRARAYTLRCIKDTGFLEGTVENLDCEGAANNGTIVQGVSATGVSSAISYTGGNGGSHQGQTVNSTGVTGLIATLEPGTFTPGEGTVTYIITGTPTSSGNAIFAISIGGQSCDLSIMVDCWSTHNATEVVEVTNPTTGQAWMDRNLGASQVATSSTDVLAYGDLYQWGRGVDGHQCRTSPKTSDLSSSDQPGHNSFITAYGGNRDWRSPQNTNLWQGASGVNNPCPEGYRLPTEAELNDERLSWEVYNNEGAFASPLKLPIAGVRQFSTGWLMNVDSYGLYWSSTVDGTDSRHLLFHSSAANISNLRRASGLSVRCIKDSISPEGTIGSLDCDGANNTGTLVQGEAASGVSSVISYTGGNGGTYQGQTVNSTGVTGLIATLEPGTFATGEGTITYTITGTPTSSGNAVFAINIGGQSCSLSIMVDCWSTHNATEIVEVTNPTTGQTWMDRNLGASQVATSSTDAQAYGDLYQWGRGADGHQCRNSPTTTTLSSSDQPGHGNYILNPNSPWDWRSPHNHNLWQGVDGINNPCPDGYRIPTEAELNTELQSWESNNSSGAFASPLKLPVAGYRLSNGSFADVGSHGYYWSNGMNGTFSRGIQFGITTAQLYTAGRVFGFSVRCIKDSISPEGTIGSLDCDGANNTGTLVQGEAASGVSSVISYTGGNGGTYQGQTVNSTGVTGLIATLEPGTFAAGAGTVTYTITGTPTSSGNAVFTINIGGQSCSLSLLVDCWSTHNATEVIEVTNPTTGQTWMDRNLGASQVATSSNDAQAFGDLYQWGRGADGHQCRTSPTTSTLSSGDQPGHGSFILAPDSPSDWRISENTNLWQGVNGVNNPCPEGYRLPSYAELNEERLSWGSNNAAGAFASPLKIPVAGYRNYHGHYVNVFDTEGRYWSCTTSSNYSHGLSITGNSAGEGAYGRAIGFSIRCLKDTSPPEGTIGNLDCEGANNNGTLVQGETASVVTSVISYTGGNGGTYQGQTVNSTGVTGLIATLEPGTFAAGAGTVNYTITGTPTSSGNAVFIINIGGQSCSLSIRVDCWSIHNATEVVEVTNPTTGKTWMDRNLGASRAATASNDAQSYGDLFQWGRGADGHQCRTSPTTSTLSSGDQPGHGSFIIAPDIPSDWRISENTNLWQGVYGINNPCPDGFRVPTEAELNAERISWETDNPAGAYASPLKLPIAGWRDYSSGSVIGEGSSGYYWSSTISEAFSGCLFITNITGFSNDRRADGASVRCIKDNSSPEVAIGNLDCVGATTSGFLVQGEMASGVSSVISYTGGNGGTHQGQTVNSTGVTGLTATLEPGTFASGVGTVTYTITGVPTSSGNAFFDISIGGQSCSLSILVDCWSTHNATDVIEVTNPTTGQTWMDRNLGASQVATSSTDELAYGDLYQWGRGADGHQCRSSLTTSTLSSDDQPGHGRFITMEGSPYDWRSPQNDNLWQGETGANNPCPDNFRVPTEAELYAEQLSWSSNDAAGAFASTLKLPVAGRRIYNSGLLNLVGSRGYYWLSTVSGTDPLNLQFFGSNAIIGNSFRAFGNSVRCIKDNPPQEGAIGNLDCDGSTNTGTLVQGEMASGVSSVISYTGGNGGTHQGQTVNSTGVTGLTATLEPGTFAAGAGTVTYTIIGTPTSSGNAIFEISIGGQSCSLTFTVIESGQGSWPDGYVHCNPDNPTELVDVTNPATGKTWMDRNLGATQSATSSTDEASYGDLFQWGRFADGHQCRTSSITSTLSNADQPGHGNFIVNNNSPWDWRNPQNNNLWQGASGINNPCPEGYRLPTEAELNEELLSWGSSNAAGAFASPLKFSMAGFRRNHDSGLVDFVGTLGRYWSSSSSGNDSHGLGFGIADANMVTGRRAGGYSVRCIKD